MAVLAMQDERKLPLSLLIAFLGILLWSGINPKGYFIWALEVFPAVIAAILLIATYRRFRFSNLAYVLIFIHACILVVGGHYTYAETPIGYWMQEWFGFGRNNYDKIGHFAQGFVPAVVVREVLLRRSVVRPGGWLSFIVVSICLGLSAFYEFIEWWVAVLTGEAAEAFLGTQGYVWDTQSDMLMCLIGAVLALVLLSKLHDKSMSRQGGA